MSQVTLYLDPETEAKMKAAARSAGVSQSRWVADLIREKTAARWPESLVKLVGTWAPIGASRSARKAAADCPSSFLLEGDTSAPGGVLLGTVEPEALERLVLQQ